MSRASVVKTGFRIEPHHMDFVNKLLLATALCRPDMHEPDEQEVSAIVTGSRLDNAGVSGEFTVELTYEHQGKKHTKNFDLATLIALARIGARSMVDVTSVITY